MMQKKNSRAQLILHLNDHNKYSYSLLQKLEDGIQVIFHLREETATNTQHLDDGTILVLTPAEAKCFGI